MGCVLAGKVIAETEIMVLLFPETSHFIYTHLLLFLYHVLRVCDVLNRNICIKFMKNVLTTARYSLSCEKLCFIA